MAGNGPPPKHPNQRQRRNADVLMRRLPASGRSGRAPAWPLSKTSASERKLWSELWKLPQAVAWEDLDYTRVVARYVRWVVKLETADSDLSITYFGKLAAEVRQLEDRLGLNPLALMRLRWEIVELYSLEATGAPRRTTSAGGVSGGDPRRHLAAVQ